MWLAARMTPASAGTFSWPRQSFFMKAQVSGFRMHAARPYQNPSRLSGTRPCTCCSRRPQQSSAPGGRLSRRPLRDWSVVPPLHWGLVVPVKRLTVAKTRLQSYGDAVRQDLALAFAVDVVTAALACEVVDDVLVVTDDARAAAALRTAGARVVADAPDAGLNPALAHGADLL